MRKQGQEGEIETRGREREEREGEKRVSSLLHFKSCSTVVETLSNRIYFGTRKSFLSDLLKWLKNFCRSKKKHLVLIFFPFSEPRSYFLLKTLFNRNNPLNLFFQPRLVRNQHRAPVGQGQTLGPRQRVTLHWIPVKQVKPSGTGQ